MKRSSKPTEAQDELEEVMWALGGLPRDCKEVYLRVDQALRRHPEETDRLAPALERITHILTAIKKAQAAYSVAWSQEFMRREEGVT